MAQITDLRVRLISLVSRAANKKEIIYKDESFQELLRVDFAKNDEELGVAYGIVYAPDEIDTQGDSATESVIRDAAYNFMKNSDLAYSVDVNHDFNVNDNAFICESWIVKAGDSLFSEVGAWAVGIKIEDEDLKTRIKNGELTGLSMYGSGVLKSNTKEVAKEQTGVVRMLKDALNDFFKGEKLAEKTEVAKNEAENVERKAVVNSELAEIAKSVDALDARIASLEETLKASKQNTGINKADASASKGVL